MTAVVPADLPPPAFTQGLITLGSQCQAPRGQVSRSSDPGLSPPQELVEWVLQEVAPRPRAAGARGGPLILEVGCGSGAVSLSLLSRLPQVSSPCTPSAPPRLVG